MNYQEWINDDDCCNNIITNCNCNKSDVCDCDNILLEISNLHTDDQVLQDEIDTKLDSSAYTPVDLTEYYTKQEIDDKGYLTHHQPLKTINGYAISGTGNIEITASGGSISVDSTLSLTSTNPVQNKVITEALNGKLDASAYTPADLSNYYNKTEVDALISGLTSQIQSLIERLNICCPTPTPVSPTDMKYTGLTSGGSEVSASCCTDPNCEELQMHDFPSNNLQSVNVGECITIIGDAFDDKFVIEDVILPSTIAYIRDVLFPDSSNMKTLTILATTPPTFVGTGGDISGCGIFAGEIDPSLPPEVIPSGFKIKVPSTSVNTYKAATVWSRYSNYIEAI